MDYKEFDGKHLFELYTIMRRMSSDRLRQYYERKSGYYQFFIRIALICTSIISLGYLYSDYQLNGGRILPTLLPRLSIIGPLILYIIFERKIRNYRYKIYANYFLLHSIILVTIWAVYYLEDKTHFSEGSFSMNLIIMIIGLGSSLRQGVISYILFFAELSISNQINHFQNFDVIMALNIPCALAILLAQLALNLTFFEHFLTELELEKALVTDPLTQVYNRQKLEEMTAENVLTGYHMPLAIVMVDIDRFKNVNDSYGHNRGDQVLRYLGKKLTEHANRCDTVIRYGGEEFLLLIDYCSVGEAYVRMEKIRKEIQNAEDRPIPFTVSSGVASYEGDFRSAVDHADAALYRSKNGGRNKVSISTNKPVKTFQR